MSLILSCFSGLGVLDEGFRQEGFCVVSAGDVLWSSLYDLRKFHPQAGIFDGVIGGDPCQSHSKLSNLVRAKGLEPSFPDMTPEFQRVIEEAKPRWFLRENVKDAPDIKPAGYDVRSFVLDHSTMDRGDGTGHEQMRKRRFWFGVEEDCRDCEFFTEMGEHCQRYPRCGNGAPELRKFIDFALFVLPDGESATAVCAGHGGGDPENPKFRGLQFRAGQRTLSLCGDSRRSFIPGGQAEVDALKRGEIEKVDRGGVRVQTVAGRHTSQGMGGDPDTTPGNHAGNPPRYSIEDMAELQGLGGEDLFKHSTYTMEGRRRLLGNAVPLPMAVALARAIKKALA